MRKFYSTLSKGVNNPVYEGFTLREFPKTVKAGILSLGTQRALSPRFVENSRKNPVGEPNQGDFRITPC